MIFRFETPEFPNSRFELMPGTQAGSAERAFVERGITDGEFFNARTIPL